MPEQGSPANAEFFAKVEEVTELIEKMKNEVDEVKRVQSSILSSPGSDDSEFFKKKSFILSCSSSRVLPDGICFHSTPFLSLPTHSLITHSFPSGFLKFRHHTHQVFVNFLPTTFFLILFFFFLFLFSSSFSLSFCLFNFSFHFSLTFDVISSPTPCMCTKCSNVSKNCSNVSNFPELKTELN